MFLHLYLLILPLILPSAYGCERCVHKSKVTYHSSSSALKYGACGYGPLAMELNGGYIASGSSGLFKDGLGCGGCFQVRCRNSELCSSKGVKVIQTDRNQGNLTDFVLSKAAFSGMAKIGKAVQLTGLGTVDAEYKRIPCEYPKHNLSVRVEEHSKKPSYLAIKFLYQGGQTEIVVVDVAQVGSSDWQYMTREYGAVWSTSRAPAGPLQLRVVVTSGYDGKWVWSDRAVLPADWSITSVYDTGLQITDVALEPCSPCDTCNWH